MEMIVDMSYVIKIVKYTRHINCGHDYIHIVFIKTIY